MIDAWKIYAEVSKPVAKAALVAHEDALDWPADWVVTGMEVADHLPDEWTFEVYLDHRPSEKEMALVAALFEDGPHTIKTATYAGDFNGDFTFDGDLFVTKEPQTEVRVRGSARVRKINYLFCEGSYIQVAS